MPGGVNSGWNGWHLITELDIVHPKLPGRQRDGTMIGRRGTLSLIGSVMAVRGARAAGRPDLRDQRLPEPTVPTPSRPGMGRCTAIEEANDKGGSPDARSSPSNLMRQQLMPVATSCAISGQCPEVHCRSPHRSYRWPRSQRRRRAMAPPGQGDLATVTPDTTNPDITTQSSQASFDLLGSRSISY